MFQPKYLKNQARYGKKVVTFLIFFCANALFDIDPMRFSAWAFYKRAVMSERHFQIYVLGSFSS